MGSVCSDINESTVSSIKHLPPSEPIIGIIIINTRGRIIGIKIAKMSPQFGCDEFHQVIQSVLTNAGYANSWQDFNTHSYRDDKIICGDYLFVGRTGSNPTMFNPTMFSTIKIIPQITSNSTVIMRPKVNIREIVNIRNKSFTELMYDLFKTCGKFDGLRTTSEYYDINQIFTCVNKIYKILNEIYDRLSENDKYKLLIDEIRNCLLIMDEFNNMINIEWDGNLSFWIHKIHSCISKRPFYIFMRSLCEKNIHSVYEYSSNATEIWDNIKDAQIISEKSYQFNRYPNAKRIIKDVVEIFLSTKPQPPQFLAPIDISPVKIDESMPNECSICLDLTRPDIWITTHCGHKFHESCWLEYIGHNKINITCPNCRTKII